VKEVSEEWTLLAGPANKTSREALLTLEQFNQVAVAEGMEERKRFPPMRFISPSSFRFISANTVYHFDWVAKKIEKINHYKKGAANLDLNLQNAAAYTIDNNLWVSLPGESDHQVTHETDKNIRHGEAAHRFEFGISKGTFWSPSGKNLAFYRVDERMVSDYPVFNLRKKPMTPEIIKYPFAGDPSHHATIGIFDLKKQKVRYLKTGGDPEHYLTNITWGPNEKYIYVAEINRDQNSMKLNRYSAKTGDLVNTIFTESNAKYVEPKKGPIFLPGSDKEFLWLSTRDGNNHLYHYTVEGDMKGQITAGNWMITSFLGFDKSGKNCFFSCTQPNPTERHTFSLRLKNKKLTLLTPGVGNHTARLHPDGRYLIDTWTSTTVPRTIRIMDAKGKVSQELLKAENPLKDYHLAMPQLFTLKAADGKTDLWARMFTPPNLDKSKKYPVLVYVYNGPGVQLVRNTWMGAAPLWMPWMADQGYIVFSVDGRGSANAGRDFEQAIFRNLGTVELSDQLAGVQYLKSLPYVDANRMVVHGWSYGGFMTCNLMMRSPGTFNAGVAGGPVIDWSMYEIMYTERYMDTPKTNAEGYKKASLHNYVEKLEGKLMLIHGTNDDVVVWQHSLGFLKTAISAGTQLDYFVYPTHPHNVRGKDRVHLMTKVLNYLMENNK
ncbi:MAG TPA: S9 family peptidase, partial [Bacteroidetes bacterium]|nr:S9 family peptidase [Bacteroidota bacterium]